MASVYRKSTGVYYLAVTFQNSRITRSLGTQGYETAKKVTPQIEKQILSELISGVSDKKSKELSFNNLVSRYLEYHGHDWANSTRKRNKELLNYTKDFVSHKFKKEARRLGIPDIRFHDLRRTFGYNLIRQGRPIYEVSKLLGHSSVTTTERHYAPLLATEIDDFVL